MAGEIDWRFIPVMQPNLQPLMQAQTALTNSVTGLGDVFKNLGTDFRNQNTNEALTQVAGIQNMQDLAGGRGMIQNMLDERGTGIDALKVLGAMDQRQDFLGNQELQGMKLEDARGTFADRGLLNNINLLTSQGKFEEASALANGLYNNSGALNNITQRSDVIGDRTYNRGRDAKNDAFRDKQYERGVVESDRNFGLSAAGTAQSLTGMLNPNGEEGSISYEFDPETQQLTAVNTPGKSNADVFAGIYSGLTNGKGGFASGNPMAGTGAKNVQTYGGSEGSSIDKTVSSNLQAFAKNTANKRGTYLPLLNNDMANVAMMAIESGGKGMGTTSYDGSSVGPMQLNRKYAAGMAKEYGIKGDPLTNEKANIQTGVAFMNDLRKTYKGDMEKVAAAYNGGEGTVNSAVKRWEKAGRKGHWLDHLGNKDPQQVRDHVAKYMEAHKRLESAHTNSKAKFANQNRGTNEGGNPKGVIDNPFENGNGPKQASPVVPIRGKAAQALGGALQNYQAALSKDGLLGSIKSTKADKLAQTAELENFKTSNGIGTGWAIGNPQGKGGAGIFGNDANDVYNELTKDKEFNNQSAANKLLILKTVISKNKAEETLGFNLHGDQLRNKSKDFTRQILAEAKNDITSKKYNHLIAAAQRVQSGFNAEGVATGAGPVNLPLESIMQMIDKDTMKAIKAQTSKDK